MFQPGAPLLISGGYGDWCLSRLEAAERVRRRAGCGNDSNLIDSDGQYRITDVDVGAVSIKVGLRDQFTSWIQNNGGRFNALLVVLRQELAPAP